MIDVPSRLRLIRTFIIKSINRELKTRPIYDCRCDERLKPEDDESTCLTYTGLIEELEYLRKTVSLSRILERDKTDIQQSES